MRGKDSNTGPSRSQGGAQFMRPDLAATIES